MTERKPAGMGIEAWADRQIREAIERGEFDDLPGAGKPLPGLNRPHDDNWWIKQKLRDENLSYPLPPTLAVRKEVAEMLATTSRATTESAVRTIVTEANNKITEALAQNLPGPPLNLAPYDIDRIVREWHHEQASPD